MGGVWARSFRPFQTTKEGVPVRRTWGFEVPDFPRKIEGRRWPVIRPETIHAAFNLGR
jgi:hypothetical protein